MKRFVASVLLMLVCAFPAFADDALPTDEVDVPVPSSEPVEVTPPSEPVPPVEGPTMEEFLKEVNEVVSAAPQGDQVTQYVIQPGESGLAVFEVDDPAEAAALDALATVGSVYPGSWSGAVLDYFSRVMAQNPGKPYVAFRESRYLYSLYFGDGLTCSNGVFSGSGLSYLRYDSDSSSYVVHRGQGSLNVDASQAFAYSNLDPMYAAFAEERGAFYAQMGIFFACVALGLWVLSRILFRRRG